MCRDTHSRAAFLAAIATVTLLGLMDASCHGQPTRVEINAYAKECWERKVPTDLIVRFGKNYRGLPLDGIKVSAFSINGVRFPTNLKEANFTKADLEGAIFSGATLDEANFTTANLRRASVSTCSMHGAGSTLHRPPTFLAAV